MRASPASSAPRQDHRPGHHGAAAGAVAEVREAHRSYLWYPSDFITSSVSS